MNVILQTTGTLSAGVAQTFDVISPTEEPRLVTFVIKNTGGTNAIGTNAILKSATGDLYATDTAITVGSIATGASLLVEVPLTAARVVRLSLTSASGTTFTVEARSASI